MNPSTRALAHTLVRVTNNVLHVEQQDNGRWYAAIRLPKADELTPELGWAEGSTEDEAVAGAFHDWLGRADEARK